MNTPIETVPIETDVLIIGGVLVECMAASLERRESRRAPFGFVRADFPEQDDKNWLAFLALRRAEGGFAFDRIPIENA